MRFRDQTAYIKAQLEEAIKTLGENYVLHPQYDAVKNKHHSVHAEPSVLKKASQNVGDMPMRPSEFNGQSYLLFLTREEIIAMSVAAHYFAMCMYQASTDEGDNCGHEVALVAESAGRKFEKASALIKKGS